MKGFSRNRRVRFLFLPGDLQLGDWFSQQDFDLYSRGFLIPHPGVLISVFGLAVLFSFLAQKCMYLAVKS